MESRRKFEGPKKVVSQITILQSGSEVFAFDTITWPGEAFSDPIVYKAAGMSAYAASFCPKWRRISREQFEWLMKHYSCMVAYRESSPHRFYCHNHRCWEQHGEDFSAAQAAQERWLEFFAIELNHYEEREI